MTRQVGNGRFVDTASRIDVDGINHLKCGLLAICLVLHLILTGRREKKAAVWCKSQTSEERRQSLISIEVGISHSDTAGITWFGGSLGRHGHHRREWQ